MKRRSSRGEHSADRGSQKQAEAQKTVKEASNVTEESKDTSMQGIVAILDPQNACGGPKMGRWAEVGHFTSQVKDSNVRQIFAARKAKDGKKRDGSDANGSVESSSMLDSTRKAQQ